MWNIFRIFSLIQNNKEPEQKGCQTLDLKQNKIVEMLPNEVYKITFTATADGKVIINIDHNQIYEPETSVLAELIHFATSVDGVKHTVDTIKSALDREDGELFKQFITEFQLLKSEEVEKLTQEAKAETQRPMISPFDAM